MKALISILLFCGLFLAPVQCCGRRRQKPAYNCPGGKFDLKQGEVIHAETTSRSIKAQANENKQSKLFKVYNIFKTKKGADKRNYDDIIAAGKRLRLSKDETEAVRLYTMSKERLFAELNEGLRNRSLYKYPAFHYWLDRALTKLPKYSGLLYRGYRDTVNIDIGKRLCLPGFTSTSERKEVAEGFSLQGCTMLIFDSSKQAGAVYDLSPYRDELEHLIPPTERFEVYKKTSDEYYNYIHLKPIGKC